MPISARMSASCSRKENGIPLKDLPPPAAGTTAANRPPANLPIERLKTPSPFTFVSRALAACVAASLIVSGCATPKVSPELSEHMRQMAEMRDTCTQYAAWVARDFKSDSAEFKRAQQL